MLAGSRRSAGDDILVPHEHHRVARGHSVVRSPQDDAMLLVFVFFVCAKSRKTVFLLFLRSTRRNMGFENVWFSRKGPKPSADGVKGNC